MTSRYPPAQTHPLSRPIPVLRSQTAPELLPSSKLSIPKQPEKLKTQKICHSPGWPDNGKKQSNKDQGKSEKKKKDSEKRSRQDEEKRIASEIKAGKRLGNKPPPAAMETQRMPPALRRSSWISLISSHNNAGEESRRSSRDERRLSGMSFGSMKSSRRSQSTPASSEEEAVARLGKKHPIVSPSAPKIPSFGWSSRRSSISSRQSPCEVSKATYDGDIITFAYRLDATTFSDEYEKDEHWSIPPTVPSGKVVTEDTRGADAGVADRGLAIIKPTIISDSIKMASNKSPPRSPASKIKRIRNEPLGDQGPRSNGTLASPIRAANEAVGRGGAAMAERENSPSHVSPSSRSATLLQLTPSHDGGSYVHKQRMYQQQQSIAGFEDQLAIQDANNLAAEYEALLSLPQTPHSELGHTPISSKPNSTPASSLLDLTSVNQVPQAKILGPRNGSVSPSRNKQRRRSDSPHVDSLPPKEWSNKPSALAKDITPSKCFVETRDCSHDLNLNTNTAGIPQKSTLPTRLEAPLGFRSSRILGFRKKNKELASLISIPYSPEEHIVAVQSAPLDRTVPEEPAARRSKIDRLFREPKPACANHDNRKRSGSLSRSPAENLPSPERARTYNRTCNASSKATANITISPRSMPRSSTEPILSPTAKVPKSSVKVMGTSHASDSYQPSIRSELERPPRKQSSTSVNVEPAHRPTMEFLSTKKTVRPVFSFETEDESAKVSVHEVIGQIEKGECLIRKPSLTPPRSNPQLQLCDTTAEPLSFAEFLPPLKHQPLAKRERQSPTRTSPGDSLSKGVSQFPTPITPLSYDSRSSSSLFSEFELKSDPKLPQRSPLRPCQLSAQKPATTRAHRSATDVGTLSLNQSADANNIGTKPVAKLFVICCNCEFWHDMPSKLYEAMALPIELRKSHTSVASAGARLETAVKCPWCEHAMTTSCCQGWTTVVYLHERHH